MAKTILWAGGEDLDFTTVGTVSPDQTVGRFRPAYARGAMMVAQDTASLQNAIKNIVTFGPAQTLWFSAQGYGGNAGVGGNVYFALTDASNVQRLQIVYLNASSFVRLQKVDGAGTATTLTTGSLIVATSLLKKIDIFINYSSGGGSFAYYENGTALASFSGNVTTDQQTGLTGFIAGNVVGNSTSWWSEMIVSTGDTRSMGLYTGYASGVGNTNTWTVNSASSLWQAVNPWAVTDVGNIAVSTTSQLAEYTMSTLISGAFAVQAVISSVRALAGTSGTVQGFAHVVRTAATDYSSGTQQLLTSMSDYQNVWSGNPSTGANWQMSDLENPAFNFGVVSET